VSLLGVIVLAMAVAGCGTPVAAPEGSDAPVRSSVGKDAAVTTTGTDCNGFLFMVELPQEWVQAELPPGYTSAGVGDDTIGTGVANPHLMLLHCGALDVNGTAAGAVDIAVVNGVLREGGFYRWEIMVQETSAVLVPFLQSLGWPAVAATIDVDATTTILDAPGLQYRITSMPDPVQPDVTAFATRSVTLGPDGLERVLVESVESGTQDAVGSTLEATGGLWGRLQAHTSSPLPGIRYNISSDWIDVYEAPPAK
jgi:hypothetical protein